MQGGAYKGLCLLKNSFLATWWRELEPVAQVLEPPPIESEKLEPLLSEQEQPLVRLPTPELERALNKILDQRESEDQRVPVPILYV